MIKAEWLIEECDPSITTSTITGCTSSQLDDVGGPTIPPAPAQQSVVPLYNHCFHQLNIQFPQYNQPYINYLQYKQQYQWQDQHHYCIVLIQA